MEIELLQELDNQLKRHHIVPHHIIDAGARDCHESCYLADKYGVPVLAFECNPHTIHICRNNIRNSPRVTLIDKAIHVYDGTCPFYPIKTDDEVNPCFGSNQGASSLFKSNGQYKYEVMEQDTATVPCTRIDTVLAELGIRPNVLWMDLQGAELIALQSFGDHLDDLDIILTEAEINPIYEGQALYRDIEAFLAPRFIKVWGNLEAEYGTNVIFVNKRYINEYRI